MKKIHIFQYISRYNNQSHNNCLLKINENIRNRFLIVINFQVRERLRVALERNTSLEEELAITKEEVDSLYILKKQLYQNLIC